MIYMPDLTAREDNLSCLKCLCVFGRGGQPARGFGLVFLPIMGLLGGWLLNQQLKSVGICEISSLQELR